MKDIALVIPGWSIERARLQPWRYTLEMAIGLSSEYRITILTEQPVSVGSDGIPDSIRIRTVSEISPLRPGPILSALQDAAPDEIIWSVTPKSVAYAPVFRKLKAKISLLITCPFYPTLQFPKAAFRGIPWHEYSALLQQSLVPKWLFRDFINLKNVSKVIVLSQAGHRYLMNLGVLKEKIHHSPVGLDPDWRVSTEWGSEWQKNSVSRIESGNLKFLFLGGAKKIRGFHHLIECFSALIETGSIAELTLLARGSEGSEVSRIISSLSSAARKQISIVGGMLSPSQIQEWMDRSDVVVLPFIFVPSDVPIAVIEAMARGKPVLSTRVDGIPELLDERGLVVDPFSKNEMISALKKMIESPGDLLTYSTNTTHFMKSYPTWDEVHGMFRRSMKT